MSLFDGTIYHLSVQFSTLFKTRLFEVWAADGRDGFQCTPQLSFGVEDERSVPEDCVFEMIAAATLKLRLLSSVPVFDRARSTV